MGTIAVTERRDIFNAFYSDGILRDHSAEPILDDLGGYIYDGLAIIAVVVTTEDSQDSADISGGIADIVHGAMVAAEPSTDAANVVGVVLVGGAIASTDDGVDQAALSVLAITTGGFNVNESGLDRANITFAGTVFGTVALAETGEDTAAATGKVFVVAILWLAEIGADAAAIKGPSLAVLTAAADRTSSVFANKTTIGLTVNK